MTSDVVVPQAPVAPKPPKQKTLGDLLKRIDAAQERMSTNNPHRNLIIECGLAVVEFANRLTDAETRAQVAEAEIARLTLAAEPRADGA